MRKLTRKRVIGALATMAVLAVAGVALAYFTSTGSGSGSATVGTTGDLTITDVVISGDLYPGGAAATVDFTINNPGDSDVKVGQVISDGITDLDPGCSAADFQFDAVDVSDTIAAGGSLSTSGSLTLNESGANQDACQGETPTLTLKVDNSNL